MNVSDPILFGYAMKVYFKDVFTKHAGTFARLDVDANSGLSGLFDRISGLEESERHTIEADIEAALKSRADVAMVDPQNKITNLHTPGQIVISQSMASAIRAGGKMMNAEGS